MFLSMFRPSTSYSAFLFYVRAVLPVRICLVSAGKCLVSGICGCLSALSGICGYLSGMRRYLSGICRHLSGRATVCYLWVAIWYVWVSVWYVCYLRQVVRYLWASVTGTHRRQYSGWAATQAAFRPQDITPAHGLRRFLQRFEAFTKNIAKGAQTVVSIVHNRISSFFDTRLNLACLASSLRQLVSNLALSRFEVSFRHNKYN